MEYFTSTLHGYEPIFVGAGCLALGYMYGRHCRSMLLENANNHTQSSDGAAAECINHVAEEEYATPPLALNQHDPAISPSISAWNCMDVEESERCGKRSVGQLEIFQMPRAKEDSLWAQSSAFKKQKGVPLITIQRKEPTTFIQSEQDSDDVPLARRMEVITNRSASINKPGGRKHKKKKNKKGQDHVTMSKSTTMTRSRSGLRELANPHNQEGECSLDDTCRSPKVVKDDGGGVENVAQEMELNCSLRDESVGLMDSQCELYEERQHDGENSMGGASIEKCMVEEATLQLCELQEEPRSARNVDLAMVNASVENSMLQMWELQKEPQCEHDVDHPMGDASMEKCTVEDAALRMCELNEKGQCELDVDPPLANTIVENCKIEEVVLKICKFQEEPQCVHNVDPPGTSESMEKCMVEDITFRICLLNEERHCEHDVNPPISNASLEECAVDENALRMGELNDEPPCEHNVNPHVVDANIKNFMVEDTILPMCELQEEPQCEENVGLPTGDACMENCIVDDNALPMETLNLEQQSLPPRDLHDRDTWENRHEVEKEQQVDIDKVLKVEIYELLHAADCVKVSFEEIVSLLEEKLKVVLRKDKAHILSLVREVINISKLLEEE